MRFITIIATLLLLCGVAWATGPITSGSGSGLSSTSMTQKVENPDLPVLVIRFDDGRASQATFAWPALSARGLDATFYVNSGLWDTEAEGGGINDDRMTEAQALSMISQGADLQSHGYDNDACSNETYDDWVELSIIPEVNWLWDNNAGLATSHAPPGNGYYGGAFDCPLATARYFNNVSLEGVDTNSLGIAMGPTAAARFEVPNNAVQGQTLDGAGLLALVKASLVGARSSQVQTLSFHSIIPCDGGGEPACSGTIFEEDEFIIFLDGIKTLVDNGTLSVMTATEGYNHVAIHQPNYNLFFNPGFAAKTGSTSEADLWTNAMVGEYAVVSDLNHGIGREVTLDQQTAALRAFRQEVHNLTPGKQYGHSIECLCNFTDIDNHMNASVWGMPGANSPVIRTGNVDCTAGQRFQVSQRWVAKSQTAMVGWEFGGQGTPLADAWTCRFPVLMEMGGDGSSAFNTHFVRNERFFNRVTSSAIASAATVVTSFDAVTTALVTNDDLRIDEGPSSFLVYEVVIDSTTAGSVNLDCAFESLSSGSGDVSCDLGTITSDPATLYPSCMVVDKDSYSEDGSDVGGNKLHLSCTNNDASSNTIQVDVEGAVLN